MWTSEITHENNQVSKIIFDFGHNVTIVADCQEKTLTRYHGRIAVEEYHNSFKIDELNRLLENVSEEINK